MHYATYGFICFGIIQLVTALICLVRPATVLSPDLRAVITDTRHMSAKAFFVLRVLTYLLFGATFAAICLWLEPVDTLSVDSKRILTDAQALEMALALCIPLALEIVAIVLVNLRFTGRIFTVETRGSFLRRVPLYVVTVCLAVAALLLWNIPDVWTVDKTWNALIIENGEVVGETTVTADFEVREYLFRDREHEGVIKADDKLDGVDEVHYSNIHISSAFEYEYDGEPLTVWHGRANRSYKVSEEGDILGYASNIFYAADEFIIDEGLRMVWINEIVNNNASYENPRSYIAYEGTYAEAAEVYDALASYFHTESYVGVASGTNPFR